MKINEIRDKTYSELTEEVISLKAQLFKLRFQIATNQTQDSGKLKTIKKDIAKVKTVMREIELQGNIG